MTSLLLYDEKIAAKEVKCFCRLISMIYCAYCLSVDEDIPWHKSSHSMQHEGKIKEIPSVSGRITHDDSSIATFMIHVIVGLVPAGFRFAQRRLDTCVYRDCHSLLRCFYNLKLGRKLSRTRFLGKRQ